MEDRCTVRTITAGVRITRSGVDEFEARVIEACELLRRCREEFEAAGYLVQTTRVVTNSFETFADMDDISTWAYAVAGVLGRLGVTFCSLGPATTERGVEAIPAILKACPMVSLTADLLPHDAPDTERVAEVEESGLASFRFGAIAGCAVGTPYFPAGFHSSEAARSFALGLESAPVIVRALDAAAAQSGATVLPPAVTTAAVAAALDRAIAPLAAMATQVARATGWCFAGVDTSFCPALGEENSVERAFARLQHAPMGGPGTLASCATLTRGLQAVGAAPRVGFCGLMLPPMEDVGLARAVEAGRVSVQSLLLYSSVCGVGLDCVPLSLEDSAEADVAATLADVAALSLKWRKPLSCRLFFVKGARAGDRTHFQSPYLCNTTVMSL